jgi:ABC-type lipoprotein release transport system permease subunit
MFVLFLRSLRYRWLEYLLAAVVVALAVATLTVQRSLSSSTEDHIHDLAHKLGKNMLVVPSRMDLSDFYSMQYDHSSMPDSYPARIQNSQVSPHISVIQSRLYANLQMSDTDLIVVGEHNIRAGREYRPVSRGKVLLGETASTRLGLTRSDDLVVNDLDLTVQEVIDTPPDGLDVGVFASLETAQEALQRPGEINAMRLAGCWCSLDVPTLAGQVENVLPNTKAVTVAGMLKAQKGTIAEAERYSVVTLVVAILLIGGVVIVLMVSQVRRQVREIGLLIATGASPFGIVLMFVLTAALVGVFGGLAGYLLGFPLTATVASTLIGLPLPVPESLLGRTLAFSTLVSVLSALLPAVYAAQLDPAEALREA